MYPTGLAKALKEGGVEAATAVELGLAGGSDADLLAAAVVLGYVVLTENVSDFARISAQHLLAGGHHPGVLVALSSRFSRRPSGTPGLAAAVLALAGQDTTDRVVYLQRASGK